MAITTASIDKALKALGIDAGDDLESIVIAPDEGHVRVHRRNPDGSTTSTEQPIGK